ncbi:MAG: hypothetical protein E6K70_24385 [Planctomycetota bacterium]|nr:MAG: hypothetical protein E6K70_24385 [Planctomycetota bacterium]
MVERRIELNRRYRRKKKMAKLNYAQDSCAQPLLERAANGQEVTGRAFAQEGVWNFQAPKTPAFLETGEFQTPFWAKAGARSAQEEPHANARARTVQMLPVSLREVFC